MPHRRAPSREGMIVTTIALPMDLHDRLRFRALAERTAMTVLVREILEAALRPTPHTRKESSVMTRRKRPGRRSGGTR
jgi:hypothetical protein